MKRNFFFLIIKALFVKSYFSMIIKNYGNEYGMDNIYNSIPRNLLQKKQKNQIIEINKNLDQNMRKLKFMKIINNLKKNAKKRHIEIKNIKIGKNIKNIFKNPFLVKDMQKMINDKYLKTKIQKVERLLKSQKAQKSNTKKQIQKDKIKKKKKENKNKNKKKRKLGLTDMAASAAGAETGSNMGFNFMPGFAGMPFPPFMTNGPHFHPEMNVSVNSIPNPSPRDDVNPFEIQKMNLDKQISQMSDVNNKLIEMDSKLGGIDETVTTKLEDKYTKLVQLNV